MVVVTISATYGAGGGVVGPAVADRLGVRFLDRAIPARVAAELGVPLDEALSHDQRVASWLQRLLASLAPVSSEYMLGDTPREALLSEADFLARTQDTIRRVAAEGGAVILGRAAAIVLREHPGVLHVRLDGHPQARVRQAMRELDVREDEARDALRHNDDARIAYVQHFYHLDPRVPRLYHMVLDSTRIPLSACVDLITTAATAPRP